MRQLQPFDGDVNRIGESLYIADIEAAGTHRLYAEHDITAVVQLTYHPPESGYPGNVEHVHHEMMDGPRNDHETMRAAVETTVDLLANGERILVHCSAGKSRSVAAAAGALALRDGLAFPDAFEQVVSAQSARVHEAVRENAREAVDSLERT